jgi:putative ABC transport system ATP-binding protein
LIGIEGVTAVRGVSATVKQGEFVCILGTSGGGKSSLLNIIGTIDNPSRGSLSLFGKSFRSNTTDADYAAVRLNKIGFVFQSFNLLPTMTAMENVKLPLLLSGKMSSSNITKKAKGLLQKMGLGDRLHHYPNMLSGGEQQRVTVARALSNDPELLLLDEPTGDLDTWNTDNVIDILLRLNNGFKLDEELEDIEKQLGAPNGIQEAVNRGITMIMVTHDEYMKEYCDRVLMVSDGKIVGEEKMNPLDKFKNWAKLRDRLKEDRNNDNKNNTGKYKSF